MDEAFRARSAMLRANEKQRAYYEGKSSADLTSKGSLATRLWRWARRKQQRLRAEIGIDDALYAQHLAWMGDLSQKRVLDLGCYTGNPLSAHLAKHAKEYVAVDLSRTAMEEWRSSLDAMGIQDAITWAGDVLSDEFRAFNKLPFDLIYAHSVLHHFEHLEVLLHDMKDWLSPTGMVISLDPIKGSGLMGMLRSMYRPFQSDAAWEHPFDKKAFIQLERHFSVAHCMGLMGAAKWAIPFYFIIPALGRLLGRMLRDRDARKYDQWGSHLLQCMQVSLCLQKRQDSQPNSG